MISIISFTHLYLISIHKNRLYYPFLGTLLVIVSTLPCGCSGEMEDYNLIKADIETRTALHFSGSCMTSEGSTLDIFAFENDRLSKLDAYQRLENFTGTTAHLTSTGGEKIIFACAASHLRSHEWSSVSSYASLARVTCDLEDEDITSLTKTGECVLDAGSRSETISLSPLACEIFLESINCDFTGTPYAGAVLKNVKVYLTHVSASCPLTYRGGNSPTRIINTGLLNEYDLRDFKHPDIIVQDVAEILDKTIIHPSSRLICYPNTQDTRIVIEGVIGNETFYWPLRLNEGKRIERNCRYTYNIRIKRKGVTDPDILIDRKDAEFDMIIKPWKEIEEYGVRF